MSRSADSIRSGKRPRDDDEISTYTSGPLDHTFGQHTAFPISTTEDPEERSVFEYLSSVRNEAENDRCFFYVDRKADSLNTSVRAGLNPQPPTEVIFIDQEWAKSLMDRFLQIKANIESHQLDLSDTSYAVPSSAALWRTTLFKDPPPLIESFFLVLDHPTVIKLIVYFTKWLSTSTNENLSKWIFLTFLRLDCLLDSDETCIVRDLGKKAQKILQKTSGRDIPPVAKYTIEMVLIIVGEYYGQRDLLILTASS